MFSRSYGDAPKKMGVACMNERWLKKKEKEKENIMSKRRPPTQARAAGLSMALGLAGGACQLILPSPLGHWTVFCWRGNKSRGLYTYKFSIDLIEEQYCSPLNVLVLSQSRQYVSKTMLVRLAGGWEKMKRATKQEGGK